MGPAGPLNMSLPEDAGLLEQASSLLEVQLRRQRGDDPPCGWAPSSVPEISDHYMVLCPQQVIYTDRGQEEEELQE